VAKKGSVPTSSEPAKNYFQNKRVVGSAGGYLMYSTRSLFFCELFGCVLCNIIAMILTVTYIVVFLFLFFWGGGRQVFVLVARDKNSSKSPF
jgi:hypothetical protein